MRIAVSLTSADPLRVGDAAKIAIAANADAIHVDLGDGRFVPWLGGSVELVRAVANLGRLPAEAHLMLDDPERYIPDLAEAGASSVLVHVEAIRYPWRVRALVHGHGMRFGIAINPATPISALETIAACADFTTLLSTEVDCVGEMLLPGTFDRVRRARSLIGPDRDLEIDGGVNVDNAAQLAAAGVNRLVAGRAILQASNPAASMQRLQLGQESAVA